MARNITPRSQDYSQWYLDIIKVAELADYAPVRGCMVIRPTGYAVWEIMQAKFDKAFKETGHVNAYFPLLIPSSFLQKEAEHVEGFAPECAVVTHAGGEKLEEPFVVRPTSETVIGSMFSKWVQSWRDLPLLINQWCNVMRWEKRPRLFLRTSEFLWQEGHTAHATRDEAEAETKKMLGVYAKIMKEDLALPVVEGVKSAGERFPGAIDTYTCETMVSDTKALQAGTSHFLGQNFAKAFEIQFQDANGEQQFAWTTSWGVSTRMIGAVIMTHSDDDGLILPPRIAPTKVVIVPISKDDAKFAEMAAKAHELADELCKVLGPLTVKVDEQNHMRPADRFFWHLQKGKGVPLRLELGEKDAANEAVRSVRRDTGAKEDIKWSELSEKVPAILDDIQKSLYEKACAFRDANTYEVDSYEALKAQLAKGGWVKCFFAGSIEDEKKIKEETQATVRCYPLAEKDRTGKCVYTGKEGAHLAIFSKSY